MFDTDKIKKAIKRQGMTQEEFAKKIGITKVTLNNYLTNRTKLDIETFIVISKTLDIKASYLLGETDEPSNKISNNNKVKTGDINQTQTINNQVNEIEILKQKLSACEELLKAKEEIINLLKNRK